MVLHKLDDTGLTEYKKRPVSKEFEIHDFIEKYPSVLEKDMMIVGREVLTGDNNYIDLLGLKPNGDTVIIEIKKDKTPRKVIAQILEYAEWVNTSISSDELNKIAKRKHLADYSSLWKKYESEFGEVPEFNEHQSLYIVAEKIDPITEKLARYLRKNGIDIFCVELNFYENDGQWFSDTKVIVGTEKAVIPDSADDNMIYDWKYFSNRRGWNDENISTMKQFIDNVLNYGKSQGWELDIKFNRRYCAIQTKTKYNICALKEKNGIIRLELPALRKKDEPPDSDLDWQWSEPQSFWRGNFSSNEMPKIDNIKNILNKSYRFRA